MSANTDIPIYANFGGPRRYYNSPLSNVIAMLGFAVFAWVGISSWWTTQRMEQEHVIVRTSVDKGASLSLSPGDYKIYCEFIKPSKYSPSYFPSAEVVDVSSNMPVELGKRPFEITPLWVPSGLSRVEMEPFSVARAGTYFVKSTAPERKLVSAQLVVTGPLHWILPWDAIIWSTAMVIAMLIGMAITTPKKNKPSSDDEVIDAMYSKLNNKAD